MIRRAKRGGKRIVVAWRWLIDPFEEYMGLSREETILFVRIMQICLSCSDA